MSNSLQMNLFSSCFNINGNCYIRDADIIAITDIHKNDQNMFFNAALIQAIYTNQCVLVEGARFGDAVNSFQHEMVRFVPQSLKRTYGWDLPEVRSRLGKYNKEAAQFKELQILLEKEYKEHRLEPIPKKNSTIHKLLSFVSEKQSDNKKAVLAALKSNNAPLFTSKMTELLQATILEQNIQLQTWIQETFPLRQLCLIKALADNLRLGRKVIAIAGFAHFIHDHLDFPDKKYSTQMVIDFLHTKKFVLISYKRTPLKIHNMGHLWNREIDAQCPFALSEVLLNKKQKEGKEKEKKAN